MGANLGNTSKGGRGRGYRRNKFTEINVTPMVDVMLVLLIIFMVAAPMLTAGVEVDLPESKAQALPGEDEPLTVTVQKDGSLFIQETKVTFEDFAPKLEAIAGANKDTRIFVRGDEAVNYGMIMKVVGEMNAAGFMKVALISEGEPR